MKFENPLRLEDCSLHSAECSCTVLPFDISFRQYTLVTVNRGECCLKIDGNEYAVAKGDSVFLLPYETCELLPGKDNEILYSYVSFSLNSMRYSDAFSSIVPGNNRFFRDEKLCDTVNNVCDELSDNAAYSDELLSLLLSQMVVYISRHFGADSKNGNSNDANLRICGQIMNFIDSRIYTMKNLREVATEMGYNYSYISTLFRKTCGVTLNTYFKTKRMEEAKRLLQNKEMSVSEIARCMNYSSVYAFSKAFKEYFGSSPGHFSGRFPNN